MKEDPVQQDIAETLEHTQPTTPQAVSRDDDMATAIPTPENEHPSWKAGPRNKGNWRILP